MIMKWLNFKGMAGIFLCLFFSATVIAQSAYEKRVEKRQIQWSKLIPTHHQMQVAGGMGFLSFGSGWDYGTKNQWETVTFLGFIPKYSTDKIKITFTLKQSYIPWEKHYNEYLSFTPLSCGMYATTILDSDFWMSQPDKYPNRYYTFSTKLRFNIFVGQRFTFKIPHAKRIFSRAVSVFYELSSNELYIVSALGNHSMKPQDYLRLSFGVKAHLF
jgi:hypothetical protein